MNIADLRDEYRRGALDEASVHEDPMEQFRIWFEEAVSAEVPAPNAMALATAGADGIPSVRMVLLKGADDRGFVFYTNYLSRKGAELEANPNAALCFYWEPLERQVRITGTVERTTAAESDAYFATRPEGSRFGAVVSAQSSVIAGREALERELAALRERHPGGDVPRPDHWGGFRVVPRSIEFWQGRPSRLHDRLRFSRVNGGWIMERLAP